MSEKIWPPGILTYARLNIKEEVKVGNIDSRVFQTMSKILKTLRETDRGPVENEIHSESRTS